MDERSMTRGQRILSMALKNQCATTLAIPSTSVVLDSQPSPSTLFNTDFQPLLSTSVVLDSQPSPTTSFNTDCEPLPSTSVIRDSQPSPSASLLLRKRKKKQLTPALRKSRQIEKDQEMHKTLPGCNDTCKHRCSMKFSENRRNAVNTVLGS